MAQPSVEGAQVRLPSILKLPTEIIAQIFDQIEHYRDRVSFSKTSRDLHKGSINISWKSIDIKFGSLRWDRSPSFLNLNGLGREDSPTPVQRMNIDHWTAAVEDLYFPASFLSSCDRDGMEQHYKPCSLGRTLGDADYHLARLAADGKISKRFQSLSFSGQFDEEFKGPSDEHTLPHLCLFPRGLAALKPRSFSFNMDWRFWNVHLLQEIASPHLSSLKIPINAPSDCRVLGRALRTMVGLKSLTLTDLPDRIEFFGAFGTLGQAILARADSLRALDIEMTNFNRPNTYATVWLKDETFAKAESLDYFFGLFFTTHPEVLAFRKRRSCYNSWNSVDLDDACLDYGLGPLKLEKLRMKNMGIPAWASQQVFDWAYLKELRLPNSDVDLAIWKDLQSAQLEVLEDVDYELLSTSMIELLSSQPSLKSLGFVRPKPDYAYAGVGTWNPNARPVMSMRVKKAPSRLGPGTAWGRNCAYGDNFAPMGKPKYPTLQALLSSLSGKELGSLVLPADMFDITPDIIPTLSTRLASLESLTWGFDYSNPCMLSVLGQHLFPNMPKLRRMDFLSIVHSINTDGTYLSGFAAFGFHDQLDLIHESIPSTLRYVRYQHWREMFMYEVRSTTYYHLQTPIGDKRWIKYVDQEADTMFEEDGTPEI